MKFLDRVLLIRAEEQMAEEFTRRTCPRCHSHHVFKGNVVCSHCKKGECERTVRELEAKFRPQKGEASDEP